MTFLAMTILCGYALALLVGGLWLIVLRSADRAERLSWEEREWLEDIVERNRSRDDVPAREREQSRTA